jgi:hypothetical protein
MDVYPLNYVVSGCKNRRGWTPPPGAKAAPGCLAGHPPPMASFYLMPGREVVTHLLCQWRWN